MINRYQATAAAEFRTATATRINVTDGKLTVDAIGGTNTKINYLEITPSDVTAPGVPVNVTATAADSSVGLSWRMPLPRPIWPTTRSTGRPMPT